MASEGVVNSERNTYLAKVCLSLDRVPLSDEEKKEIERCCLIKPPYADSSNRGSCTKGLEYPEWVYPYYNEDSEHNLGRLNRSIKEQGRDSMET